MMKLLSFMLKFNVNDLPNTDVTCDDKSIIILNFLLKGVKNA